MVALAEALGAGATTSITLMVSVPARASITYTARVLAGTVTLQLGFEHGAHGRLEMLASLNDSFRTRQVLQVKNSDAT